MKTPLFTFLNFLLAVVATMTCGFMEAGNLHWALVRVSVANVREHPGHASEMGSQVIMGTPLRITSETNGWYGVETPEGYKGFVIGNSLQLLSEKEMERWRSSERVVVSSPDQTYIYEPEIVLSEMTESERRFHRVSDVVDGSLLEIAGSSADPESIMVSIPDGRVGQMFKSDVENLSLWSNREVDMGEVTAFAHALMGTPYLWGGTSTKSIDCSGLAKISYLSQGVILPRNASQQAKIGIAVPVADRSALHEGDLLFFGNKDTGRVNHVGIYLGNDRFIHCSGRVKINSLSKDDADYTPVHLLGVRRLDIDTLDSLSLRNHNWF